MWWLYRRPSVATCVDLDLTSKFNENRYYEKCCYMRYRIEGKMGSTCLGIFRRDFIDIPNLIDIWEKDSPEMKIYEFNCNSSYLKIFVLGFALFSLLF